MNTAVTLLRARPAGDARATGATGWRRWISRVGDGIRRSLEAAGRARAQRHLMDFADQCEAMQPALAKELRAASRQVPMT